jgi:predicted RNA-binding protein with PUA-like domain
MAKQGYWLFKSEPAAYSFSDLMGEEDRTAEWDGVRNYQARNYLRDEVKEGDRMLFYHSGAKAKSVVGTALVVRGGYPDHTAWDPDSEHPDPKSTPEKPTWYMVDIKGEAELSNPVTLAQIKATPALENCSLLTRPRISIHPMTKEEWDIILAMGE